MTIQEAVNRTNNLVATAIISLAGFAFFPEVIFEDELKYKVDDALLFIVGLIALLWYKKGDNKFKRSKAPVIFVVLGLLIKIGAVILEHTDKEDVGDDFGALVLFTLSTLLVVYLYKSSKKLLTAKN